MPCRLMLRACCALVLLWAPLVAHGATKTWTAAVDGDFADPARWTGGVPGAVDRAAFNVPGTYTLTFDNSPNALTNPVLNQELSLSGGDVTFISGSGGPYTHHLTGAGADIRSGTLTLGSGRGLFVLPPVHLSVDNSVLVGYGAVFYITEGSQVDVSSLHIASISGYINGSTIVEDFGTALNAENATVGARGNSGTLTFRNRASGTFGGLTIGDGSFAVSSGVLNVESNSDLTIDSLYIAAVGPQVSTGTVNIQGIGTTMTVNSRIQLGNEIGSGVINVQSGGSLLASDAEFIDLEESGTINITGGTVELPLLRDFGGTINFNSGSLSYIGDLSVGATGLLGSSLYLTSQHELTLDGRTFVDAFHTLGLYGGSLITESLSVAGTFDFSSGTLSITGVNGLTIGVNESLGNVYTLGANRTINVTNTATVDPGALLVVESGGAFNAGTLANDGTVVLDGIAAALGGTAINNNGLMRGEGTVSARLINGATGEIRAQNGTTLTFSGATNTNAGELNLQGGTVEFAQGLTNSATGEILGRGTLIVGAAGLANGGHVAFSSGITDVFGNVSNNSTSNTRGIAISGNANVTFWDNVTNAAGSLFRVASGASATFFGALNGAGISGTGDVYLESDISPGSNANAATTNFGVDVFLGAGANLSIQVGGTALGSQFDHVQIAGAATLDGLLTLSLMNGFAPTLGHSFEVLHADGGIFGTFADESLPSLSGGLGWHVIYSNFAVTLQVVAAALSGDFNHDGTTNSADYVVWRKGVADGNYATWRNNFGDFEGSGAGAASPFETGVPEPSSITLLALASVAICWIRRKNACSRR